MSFREIIRQHPFLRILLPLIFGILLAEYFPIQVRLENIFLLVSFAAAFLVVIIPFFRKSYSFRVVFGLISFFFFLSLGAFRTSNVKNNMLLSIKDSCYHQVTILEYPIEKNNSYACPAQINVDYHSNNWSKETAKAILYFQKDSSVTSLCPGDRLLLKSDFERVRNAGNPSEFDYAHYLKTKHIFYSSYVKSSDYILLPAHGKISLRAAALKWRNQLLQIYRKNGIRNDSFDILAALSLGYKSSLDPEIKKAWSDAGAMHVLAVSGLHVGIIYFVMNFLFQFLLKLKFGSWLRGIFLLMSLWGYAMITGLSPSVMRAACMFSFLVIGEVLNRKGSVFNSLAASAFFLLTFDPYLIFTVGFQFSYLAVAGIVFLQPKLDSLLYFSNPILNKFWILTTVGISAQIATFPLSLYYFHQFPVYFLLSGYVVILMAGLLIYLSAILLIVSPFELISEPLGWILKWLVKIMNSIIIQIHQFPGSVIHNCHLTRFELVILYAIILSLIFIIVVKRKYAVFSLLLSIIAFQSVHSYSNIFVPANKFIVFNAQKSTLVAFQKGKKLFFLQDKNLDSTKFKRLTKNYMLTNNITSFQRDTLAIIDARCFGDQSFLFVGEEINKSSEILNQLQADFILFRKKGLKSDPFFMKVCTKSKIIMDASINRLDLKRLRDNVDIEVDSFFNVRDSGAFVCSLSSDI